MKTPEKKSDKSGARKPVVKHKKGASYKRLNLKKLSVLSVPASNIPTEFEKQRISEMLAQAYQKAAEDPKGAAAMISATLAIAKLNGYLNDKQDNHAEHEKSDMKLTQAITEARQRLQDHKNNQTREEK